VSEQIAFGTCPCGASGQLFGVGWCAHCMIQWQDVRISALTQVNQELRSKVALADMRAVDRAVADGDFGLAYGIAIDAEMEAQGIPDLCPRGTCGVRIPNCPECSMFIPAKELADVLYECAFADKVQAEEKWREAGNTTPLGDANPVLITASVLLRRHGEKEAADQVEAIARTFARLVRAMKVTPMTSTNPFGLSAIGDALAEIEGLDDNERCGKDNG
jgi:hypothetical protein